MQRVSETITPEGKLRVAVLIGLWNTLVTVTLHRKSDILEFVWTFEADYSYRLCTSVFVQGRQTFQSLEWIAAQTGQEYYPGIEITWLKHAAANFKPANFIGLDRTNIIEKFSEIVSAVAAKA